ncbi:MAG: flavin reductase [Marmoricola sp.]|nr:flavin reductase [Marmoricola sp.]
MTIHSTHPFAEPADPVRRFRARLGGAVSLWTTGDADGRAGLTVSSLMVAAGEPARIIALLDPDADFTAAFSGNGRAVVQLLDWNDRDLAEAFAGTVPAPGGPFRAATWEQTSHGPALPGRSRALVDLVSVRAEGWSSVVTATVEEIHLAEADEGLEHRRGRYHRAAGSAVTGD